MKVLTIDRATWGRGRNNASGTSFLLDSELNQMCCLGFYALQHAGATLDDIDQHDTPGDVPELAWGDELRIRNGGTGLCINLMHYNDREMPEPEREQKITELFASMNVRVEFVG